MAPINDLPSLWQKQDVGVGLQYTSDLLNTIVGLATQSPNHSLKAQHLLSRGIEILASIQQFLTTGTDDFLDAIRTIQSLEVTETVLVESITVLNEDVKNPVPSDRAVLSSWHLNRNTFSSQLRTLSTTGPKQPDAAWTDVLRDVVRADHLTWTTRLVEDMTTLEDQDAKQSLGTIISTLENPETSTAEEAEEIQTDSVLAVMCLADAVARPSEGGRTEVLQVVNDMAKVLKTSERSNWKSLSDRLHNLPVCRQVEKPLLVHKGSYAIPDIVGDVQTEVDLAGARIMDLIPFGSTDADVDVSRREEAKKHLWQMEAAMKDAAGHLKALKARGHTSFKGEKTDSWISYAVARLLTNTALAITPASGISTFSDPLHTIVSSVSGFIDALGVFNLGPTQSWQEAFTRSLGSTASLLTQFGRSNVNIASPREATFGSQPRTGPSVATGSSTPERISVKEEKHGLRERVADLAGAVKDKLPGGKSS